MAASDTLINTLDEPSPGRREKTGLCIVEPTRTTPTGPRHAAGGCWLVALVLVALWPPAIELAQARPRGAPSEPLGAGTLLIAAPQLQDPNFVRTVVLVLSYDARGAVGLVINRPVDVTIPEVRADTAWTHQVLVFAGGPVEPNRVVVLLDTTSQRAQSGGPGPEPPAAEHVFGPVYSATSPETLGWAARTLPASAVRAYVGYAGWSAGQLEREVENGDWHLISARAQSVFWPSEQSGESLWQRLQRDAGGTWVWRPGASPPTFRAAKRKAARVPSSSQGVGSQRYTRPGR